MIFLIELITSKLRENEQSLCVNPVLNHGRRIQGRTCLESECVRRFCCTGLGSLKQVENSLRDVENDVLARMDHDMLDEGSISWVLH